VNFEHFASPAREFSPVPLWWWSGDTVTAERLRWQLERLAAGGVFNVVVMNVAPTSPLYGKDADDPPFLSEPWWELFEGVCRDASELGVRVWFYDQIGFSGANFQGQVVRERPAFAGRWLERTDDACPEGGTPLVELDGWLYYTVARGFDYFSAEACTRLFAMVHGRFEERVGGWFGSTIAGSFQDELPDLPTWGPDFAERFLAVAGYDPLPHLAALFEEPGAGFRADYHRVRGALGEAAFFRPLHEWHERHGLLCGVDQQYGAREGRPVASSRIYGDYPRTHRWFSAPGSDHHGDAKFHSSLAHHYDRPRVWIEAFHTSGWGGTLEETFDWLLPWLGAGANLYDPHATYYSTRAGWWEWAPPATDWRQPYWRHYGVFAQAVARLCAALTWGTHACDIGVLYPAATGRASLRTNAVDEVYEGVVGRMKWFNCRPGALNAAARDFDVLDDDTVAAAMIADGELRTRDEAYRIIILPGCEVLEPATAQRLAEFAGAGGTLIAVGSLPDPIADAALHVHSPSDLAAVLEPLPAQVRAPVPTLLRRDGDVAVLFVPAIHPRATEIEIDGEADDWHSWTQGLRYRFAPVNEPIDVVVAGMTGEPQLWEPFSGRRREVESEPVDGGVRVRVTFDDGPCALLVWGADGDAEAPAQTGFDARLDGPWEVELVRTLEDDWGDLAAPAADVETWELDSDSGPVRATFGPRAAGANEWSWSRGIDKDPVHVDHLGGSGRVPEEFLHFDASPARLRAVVHTPSALATNLAVGANAAKRAWLDGVEVELSGRGYLTSGPVSLAAGETVLELEFTANAGPIRGHFAFVADLDGYARPEFLRAADLGEKSSIVAFSTRFTLPADATSAPVLVGANGPARVLVDGVEAGRQGGFDPYAEIDKDRLQPYDLTGHLGAGEHELRLELLDLGRTPPTALFDGLVHTRAGTVALRSDEHWTATRDGAQIALDLRLDQHGDPAYNHLFKRPHPLPGGAWLEPGRAAVEPLAITPDREVVTQRLRVLAPPGARSMTVPLAPGCAGTVRDVSATGTLVVALDAVRPEPVEIVVEPAPGLYGGALLTGPVAFAVGPGEMELVDWQDAGLANHSGGVRYRRRLDTAIAGVDLGEVRGTAEVFVDGVSAGVRVCSPYRFELDARAGATLEILVLNTLGPHLDAVSPTPYVFEGQRRSGLFGPVRARQR
jgi:hypothetical protein